MDMIRKRVTISTVVFSRAIFFALLSLSLNAARALAPGDLDRSFTPGVPNVAYSFLLPYQNESVLGVPHHGYGVPSSLYQFTREGLARHFLEKPMWIERAAVQRDGRILVTKGYDAQPLMRLNPDGMVDQSFQTSPMVGAFAISLQADDKILVACSTTFNNDSFGLRRFLPDGRLDPSFSVYYVPSLIINSIDIQSDGDIIILNPNPLRLSSNGVPNPDYHLADIKGYVTHTLLDSNDRLYIGGTFTNVGGFTRVGIARLKRDGYLDQSFELHGPWQLRVGGTVDDLKWLSDGSFLLKADDLGKVLEDGSFTPFLKSETYSPSERLPFRESAAVTSEHVLLAGVLSSSLGDRHYISRLFHDGQIDPLFQVIGRSNIIGLHLHDDSMYVIGQGSSWILRNDGTVKRKLAIGGYLTASAQQADGKIIVASRLNKSIMRHFPDGGLDTNFVGPKFDRFREVTQIRQRRNGKIVVSGDFLTGDPIARANYMELNSDGSIAPSKIPFNRILAFDELKDGRLIVVGYGASDLYRLDESGSIDPGFARSSFIGWTFGSYSTVPPEFVKVSDDGSIFAAGSFLYSYANSPGKSNRVDLPGLAKLMPSGELDLGFNAELPTWTMATRVAIQQDGKLLVVKTYPDELVRLNSNGKMDRSFKTVRADGAIEAIEVEQDGSVLIAGHFTQVNGLDMPGIARLFGDAVVTRFVVSATLAPSGIRLRANGPPTQALVFERSTNLLEWSEAGRIESFTGEGTIETSRSRFGNSFFRTRSE